MKKIFLILLLGAFSTIAHSHPREMILAGGAMKICTSLSLDACKDGKKGFSDARKIPRYQIKDNNISVLLNPGFWNSRVGAPAITDLHAMLVTAKQKARGDIHSASALDEILEKICVGNAKTINCTRSDAIAVWKRLLDEEKFLILSAFEIPEFKNGKRIRETASLNDSKNPHGVTILKTFVDAAAKRSPGKRPRILFVTASSADPYDAVDFYLSAMQQTGAETVRWPIYQAIYAVI